MDKCLVLFVEGPTEEEFYSRLISNARERIPNKKFDFELEIISVNGVGGFKKDAFRIFRDRIQWKYGKNFHYTVALCRDTDVFEGSQHPAVNWNSLAKEFKNNGVDKVINIKAKHCIEDWFLLDAEGVLSYLGLPKNVRVSGGNGFDKMKKLFRRAHRIYYKGSSCKGLIEHLNIEKIVSNVQGELNPLYRELGVCN